ncbi:PrsW family glutamic-type intramembrane protease [Maioricimonas rarisocia]|uniref:PrsW family glutamic-type intramembrane protease n=1 Tax=Maioricimonas rarisocia TaxID=2528026 RepID=UPI0011AAD940|nr:PrsW family glutamic-type intramembrane protease [Maioricimonas rarisocia]
MNVSASSFVAALFVPLLMAGLYAWLLRPKIGPVRTVIVFTAGGLLSFVASTFLFVPLLFRPFALYVVESDSVLLAGFVESLPGSSLPEELAKIGTLLFACVLLLRKASRPAIVYAGSLVGLGFAAIENFWWAAIAENSSDLLLRVTPTLGHSFLGIIGGWLYLGIRQAEPPGVWHWIRLLLFPTLLHFLFNFGLVGFEFDFPGLEEIPEEEVPPPELLLPILGAFALVLTAALAALVEFVWAVKIIRTIRRESRLPFDPPAPAAPS